MWRMPNGMTAELRALRGWLPALAVSLVLANPASADVVVKQKTVTEGLGGFGNSTLEQTQIISGDKSRTEDHSTYTGKMKGAAGKPSAAVSITRLDKEVIWHLDPEKKEYTQLTFAEMREMVNKGAAEMGKPAKSQDEGLTFTVEVKKTGVKQDVNGFAAEEVVVTCTGKPVDPKKTEMPSAVVMKMDLWLTKVANNAEAQAFRRKLGEKMGRELARDADAAAMQMYGNGMKQLRDKMKDLDGFPVRTTLIVENSLPPEQQAQMADAQKEMAKAQAEAEKEMAKAQAEHAAQEKKEDASDAKDARQSIASGGGLGGALGGFLGKKMNKAASKKAEAAAAAPTQDMMGSVPALGGPLFKSVTDVLSIANAPAPAGSFDVPAGYTLKSTKH